MVFDGAVDHLGGTNDVDPRTAVSGHGAENGIVAHGVSLSVRLFCCVIENHSLVYPSIHAKKLVSSQEIEPVKFKEPFLNVVRPWGEIHSQSPF